MKVTPALTVMRFAQLAAGDLFIAPLGGGDSCVAIVSEDPALNGKKDFVPLGPNFPGGVGRPTLLTPPGMTVISFGKSYVLRLPVSASGWSESEPPPETVAIAVADSGCYVRADAGSANRPLRCYIDIATGLINLIGGGGLRPQYAPPAGIRAYAVEWQLVTDEPEPRPILAYPFT